MADVTQYFPFVFKWEGKVANNKNDHGGLTNMGVTWATFQSLAKSQLGIEPTKDNFYKMTKPQVEKIITWYWNQVHGDQVKDQRIANVMADWYWGSGGYGSMWVNRTLNKEFNVPLPKNTLKISLDTVKIINKLNQDKLYNALIVAKKAHIDSIVKKDKTQQEFYAGWINRLNDMWELNKKYVKKSTGIIGILALATAIIIIIRKVK